MADIITISDDPEAAIRRGCEVLARGQPVAIPTETVYGLAADATNPQAIARIYEAKGRPQFNPLICHVADMAMAEQIAVFDAASRRLAERFWPGPLTLVLPLEPASPVHPLATAGLPSVGVRMPTGFARDLIAAFGRPLAAPSANTSGRVSPTTAGHVAADLGQKIELILDAGPAEVGLESTIVKIGPDGAWLLRPGGLSSEDIEAELAAPLGRRSEASAAIEAPGMMASHYAPGAAVRLNATSVAPDEVLVRFGPGAVAGERQAQAVVDLSPSGDLGEAAARLFDTLKLADAAGAATIAVMPIPRTGLGEAINDRLARAAAPRG